MTIKTFIFNPFQENTYLIYDETGEAVIIDPGCYSKEEEDELKNYITSNKLKLKHLLNTHSHIDHILGNSFINEEYKLPLASHKEDEFLIKNAVNQGAAFGLHLKKVLFPKIYLKEGDIVSFGKTHLKVIHAPGHSPGSIVFYNADEKFMMVGDVLFNQSIGRTDLPGGNLDQLMHSIKNKLFPLGDDIQVYSGHGPSTNIGQEIRENPFLI